MACSPLSLSRQLIQVIAPDWKSSQGELQRYGRHSPNEPWKTIGKPIPVRLGRCGLAWGRGLHTAPTALPRQKKEGDGCAPAGIFAITALFGYDAWERPPKQEANLPYYRAHAALKCIDDPASRYYNQIVDQTGLCAERPFDWSSHEAMLRMDQRYAIGAVIAHNPHPVQAGAGSCIFLHVWKNHETPTSGCTAASLDDMNAICRWLDRSAQPLLVQLPISVYRRCRTSWELP